MGKRIQRHAKTFRRVVAHAGLADPQTCVRSFERRLERMLFSDLYAKHSVYPTIDAEHVYSVMAMCLELRDHGLADKQICDAVNAGFVSRRHFFDALLTLVDHLPCTWAIVRKWNVADHNKRVADGSIDYDLFEVRDHEIEYSISGCRYVDMFEAWDARSLCKIFCETDTRSYSRLTRHVKFVRHSDLSDGTSCHDKIIRCERSKG